MQFAAPERKLGFTLIELLVSISILGILSTVGLVTYHNAQINANDQRRKQDLILISQALELYKKANGKYPVSNPGPYTTGASNMNNWYADSTYSNWTTALGGLVPNYISSLPKDPKNNCAVIGNNINTNCYSYTYWSVESDNTNFPPPCPQGMTVMYVLIANLENPNDPDAIGPSGSSKRQVCGRDIQQDLYKSPIDPGLYVIVGY